MEDMIKTVNWNNLSEWGLIYKINKEVLHPLGLALSRDPETGVSEAIIIADDLIWEYTAEIEKNNEERLKRFIDNREIILKELLKEKK